MSLTSNELRKLATLKLSPEQMSGVLELLAMRAEKEEAFLKAEDDKRAAEAARKRAERAAKKGQGVRGQSEDNPRTIAGQSEDMERTPSPPVSPPFPLHPLSPPISPPSRSSPCFARDLEAELRKAAGWQNEPAPKLAVIGEIQALIDNGADLDLDVLPVVRARAKSANPTSWRYFVKAIVEARDQRISAATVVSLPTATSRSPSHAANRQNPPRSAIFEAIHASIDRAEGRAAADGS